MNFKHMILTKHNQMDREGNLTGETFRMVPLSNESIFLIGEFDLASQKLVMCTREKKEELQVVPKMSESGEPMPIKNKPGAMAVERRLLPEYFELHFSNIDAIVDLINATCINSDTFKYQQYLAKIEVPKQKAPPLITLS